MSLIKVSIPSKVSAKDAAPKPGDKVFWRNGPLKFEGVFVKSQGGRNLVKTDHGEIWVYSNVYLEGQKPTYRDTPFGRFYDSSEMSLSSDSAEFKKGDKVVSRSSGAKGVVEEVYGNGQYAVLFEGAKNPDRIGVERIKAADSTAGAAQDFAAMDDFKNPRFISSLTQDVSRLKEKYESALKESKDNFAYWFKRKVLDEATSLKEIIVEAIATKETSPEEVAKLKPLKDECNKAIQKANAMLSKINSLN